MNKALILGGCGVYPSLKENIDTQEIMLNHNPPYHPITVIYDNIELQNIFDEMTEEGVSRSITNKDELDAICYGNLELIDSCDAICLIEGWRNAVEPYEELKFAIEHKERHIDILEVVNGELLKIKYETYMKYIF